MILAAYSSFLALRDAVVAPDDRFQELKALRDEVAGSSVLALTSDRYTDYYLRGAEVRSPAKNAEQQIQGRLGKEFRLPVDFDSVYASDLDGFDYVVTTDAEYQSGAPPNFEEVQRTDSYVLWKRNGVTPFVGVLAEASRPGRIFRCNRPKFKRLLTRTGVAITWPRPVIAKRGFWEPDETLAPGESATQTFDLPPGKWDLSFQYSSEAAPIEVSAGDLTAELPPGVEGGIPYRPNEGPFWPVGEVNSDGGPLEITVRAKELSTIQKLLGADSPAILGNIAATRLERPRDPSLQGVVQALRGPLLPRCGGRAPGVEGSRLGAPEARAHALTWSTGAESRPLPRCSRSWSERSHTRPALRAPIRALGPRSSAAARRIPAASPSRWRSSCAPRASSAPAR